MLKYYRKKSVCWKCVSANSALFINVLIHCVETVDSLTTINTFSWFGDPEVTHPPGVRGPGYGKDIYVWVRVLLLLWFYLFVKNRSFVTTFCNSSCKVYSFSILNILPNLWPIMRVSRYRPSIFNCLIK